MSNLSKNYILIVDDTPKNIQILATILNEHNYKVKAATNGKQAIQMIEKELPDLVLLDVMMPELDGYETCKQLKTLELSKEIPIIFLTAKVEADDIIKGFEVGAVDYITKPFNSAELLARVNTHLELKTSKDLLLQIGQERKELIHVLCHDLLNPISFVLTLFNLSEEDSNIFNEMKNNIKTAMQNGVDIINLVRTTLAVEDNKLEIQTEPFNLKHLINESANVLNQKLKNKNINLEINVEDDITVKVERISFLNSVINNLLTNAIKFSFPDSKILINGTRDNNSVILSIRDFGVGIPKNLLEDIFNITKPTTRTGTSGETGTGFGMPLVQKYINSYGGTIKINSNEKSDNSNESGTDVIITLSAK